MLKVTIGNFETVHYIPDGTHVTVGHDSVRFGNVLDAKATDRDTEIFMLEDSVERVGETYWRTLFMNTPDVRDLGNCRALIARAIDDHFRNVQTQNIKPKEER